MTKRKKHLLQDIILLALSVAFAIFIVKTGTAEKIIFSLEDWKFLGIILAGMFFTSMFTTAPSIALLGTFAETTPLLIVAILGGFGAMLGDYVIFRFAKDRISKDIKYLQSFSRKDRFSEILKTQLFKFFIPLLGAFIIASPFPDEIGVIMLGVSKVKNRFFLTLSFVLNGIGILVVGWIAKTVISF